MKKGERMEKVYRLVKDSHRVRTLHVGNARLPLVLSGDSSVPHPGIAIATTLLLEHFAGEHDAEVKARLLARPVSLYLQRFGDEWEITEAQLNDIIMCAFVEYRSVVESAREAYAIELVSGCRRDTLRSEQGMHNKTGPFIKLRPKWDKLSNAEHSK
jgi:hypothetical protein